MHDVRDRESSAKKAIPKGKRKKKVTHFFYYWFLYYGALPHNMAGQAFSMP